MREIIQRIAGNVSRVFIGKDDVIELALIALAARGHLLIEDVPGLGKTLLARSLARSLAADFQRIQFTPDLLPTDITGVSVFDPSTRSFEFIPGPVFSEVLLADEINRTSPRTQAALLEAMEERQVTTEGVTRPLAPTFFVVATQNPVELAGTYPLPEAQLDRFLMRISLGYPDAAAEARILEVHGNADPAALETIIDLQGLAAIQRAALDVTISPEMRDYVVAIAASSRQRDDVQLGISPRGSLALLKAARACALLRGKEWVGPDEIKHVAPAVLGHRLVLPPQSELESDARRRIVGELLGSVAVPVGRHA